MRHYKYILLFISLFNCAFVNYAQIEKKEAPLFRLPNQFGDTINLNTFKGKIIFLDFWATWCKPCNEEFPHFKKIQNKFSSDTSIVFISISFDSDTARWKNSIDKKKLPGIHLISQNGKLDDLINKYEVRSIPRYVIINEAGFIIDYDAKRPSEYGLEEDLKLLIENLNKNKK